MTLVGDDGAPVLARLLAESGGRVEEELHALDGVAAVDAGEIRPVVGLLEQWRRMHTIISSVGWLNERGTEQTFFESVFT